MTKPDNATIHDLLTLGEAALTTLLGAAQEFKNSAESKRDVLVRKFDLVTKEEFDAAFAMIKKARAAQEVLDERLRKIEEKLGIGE